MSGAEDPLLRRVLERAWDAATEGLVVAPTPPAVVTVDDLVREVARYSPLGDEEDTAVRVETSSRQALCDLLRIGLPPEVDAWHPTPSITMWGLPVVVCPELEPGEVRLVRADGTVVAWGRVA